jgi:hypothetical protein
LEKILGQQGMLKVKAATFGKVDVVQAFLESLRRTYVTKSDAICMFDSDFEPLFSQFFRVIGIRRNFRLRRKRHAEARPGLSVALEDCYCH